MNSVSNCVTCEPVLAALTLMVMHFKVTHAGPINSLLSAHVSLKSVVLLVSIICTPQYLKSNIIMITREYNNNI